MERAQVAGSAQEDLWRGLPGSNVYKPKKLAGWSEANEEGAEGGALESRTRLLEGDRYAELKGFLDGQSFNAVMLGAYHLVLQGYLDDIESLIGCCLLEPAQQRAVLRPSYVYAEDDEPIESLFQDVERQLRSGSFAAMDSSQMGPRAPVFFYLGIEGAAATDSAVRNTLTAHLPERGITLTAIDEGERAEILISARSATAHGFDLADFQRRYETALSSLLASRSSSAGEIRGRLIGASVAPANQLTEMQKRVITLWAKVLGIAEEGLTESSNYFEIGGTSLNAFKLVNRVRLEFQHDLSIRDIIESSTVQEFARLLAKPRGA